LARNKGLHRNDPSLWENREVKTDKKGKQAGEQREEKIKQKCCLPVADLLLLNRKPVRQMLQTAHFESEHNEY
jgi:hypothetical protein